MSDKNYPVPYYKHLHQPKSAHSPKEEEILKADGWNDNRYTLPAQEFPKTLYDAKGNTATVGKYPDGGGPIDIEAAAREESDMNKKGYTSKAVARKLSAVERTPLVRAKNQEIEERAEEASANAGRMDAMEERMDGMEGSLGEILQLLRSQQSADTAKRGPGRPKQHHDEEKAG